MNKEFDFDNIGKTMPYRTPEGFFERMQAETMARVQAEKRRKRMHNLKIGITAALGIAAIWCGVAFFFPSVTTDAIDSNPTDAWLATAEDPFDLYLQQLSDEELEAWIEFSENDIYYEFTTENEEYEDY